MEADDKKDWNPLMIIIVRYGSVFRTSLVGAKVIGIEDPDIIRFVFQEDEKLFKILYTSSFLKIFGNQNSEIYAREFHKFLRNLLLQLMTPKNLKDYMLHEVDQLTRETTHSWTKLPSIDVKRATGDMILDYFAKKIINYEESNSSRKLRANYSAMLKGSLSTFLEHNLLSQHSVLLSWVPAFYNMNGELGPAGLEKYHQGNKRYDRGEALVENPSVLAELKFINETLRHSHIAPVMFGKATTDVQIKAVHRDPIKYSDPLVFNPRRWEGKGITCWKQLVHGVRWRK